MDYFKNICQMTEFVPKTTFWEEITFSEDEGDNEIENFVNHLIELNKDKEIEGTELTMYLNWKIWEWYKSDEKRARLYEKLWKKIDKYILDTWKGEKLSYYLRTTD